MQILVTIPDYADEGEDDAGREERAQVLSKLVAALSPNFLGVSAQPLYCAGLHVVAVGSPFEGMALEGPFVSYEEAMGYAQGYDALGDDWHIVPLQKEQ